MYPAPSVMRSCGLDGSSVTRLVGEDMSNVPIRVAPSWMRRLWRGPVAAMTLPWAVYVAPEVLLAGGRPLATLLLHEFVHVRQWRHLGTLPFLRRYLADYAKGRRRGLSHADAYRAIGFEVEARSIAARSFEDDA